jgi:hypothetical protein
MNITRAMIAVSLKPFQRSPQRGRAKPFAVNREQAPSWLEIRRQFRLVPAVARREHGLFVAR